MYEYETLLLTYAITTSIILGILVVILVHLKKSMNSYINDKENEIKEINKKLTKKQTMAFRVGVNTTVGDYSQILGEFALLSKYDQIITLSTTSRQPSLDLIGVNQDSLDFLEIKKRGTGSTNNEKHVKQLVNSKKVYYKIYDVDLPDNFTITERSQRKKSPKLSKYNLQKRKSEKNTFAYEKWTSYDDDFLKTFWKNDTGKQTDSEKIQYLSEKLFRSKGAIISRLKKFGLIDC